jgi:Uma2 family endonuclease
VARTLEPARRKTTETESAGFEPDECWWIAHEAKVRRKKKFDFQRDPPPDLAIEIEMSRSLISRVGIFAAMGVKELWRHNGKRLRFCVLQDDGTYADQDASLAFPFLTPADLEPYLRLDDDLDETTRVRRFCDWLREQVA